MGRAGENNLYSLAQGRDSLALARFGPNDYVAG